MNSPDTTVRSKKDGISKGTKGVDKNVPVGGYRYGGNVGIPGGGGMGSNPVKTNSDISPPDVS